MTLYYCPKTDSYSHEDCSCPGSKDDEVHSARLVPEDAVARLVNLLTEVYADIRDGEDEEATMEAIADIYLELTGNLI